MKENSSNDKIQRFNEKTGKGFRFIQVFISTGGEVVMDEKEAVRFAIKALEKADFQNYRRVPHKTKLSKSICRICGWIHDARFTQIKVSQNKVISLGGVLPDIVAATHRALEKGLALSTKDEELLKICGSYKHPSKAFDDLKHREDYKILFNRRRGFISLRGANGIDPERKSETNTE
jgi:hypothetical protein